MKQYQQIQPGLRRHVSSGKYQAYKKVKYKQHTKTFSSKREALSWLKYDWDFKTKSPDSSKTIDYFLCKYIDEYVFMLEPSTREHINRRLIPFLAPVSKFKLEDLNRGLVSELIEDHKLLASSKRRSFLTELKMMNSFINWICLRVEGLLNPINKTHKKLAVISRPKFKNNKVSSEQVIKFFSKLSVSYKELALLQFYTAARIGEVSALQVNDVNFERGYCRIQNSMIWSRIDCSYYLKPYPKNGEARVCYLPGFILEILKTRVGTRTKGFIFNIDDKPLKYRAIQYHYSKALKLAGIENVSVTHFLRHSAANIVREASNSLDMAQAMTGHKDRSIVEKIYTNANPKAQKQAMEYLVESMMME